MIHEKIQQLGIQPQPLSELYKDIELTEEEKAAAIEKALFEARWEKAAQIEREKYWRKVVKPVEVKKYTSADLLNFLLQEPEFVIDQDNEKIVKLLCEYFTNDPEFETKGFSLNKGLLLFGGVGVGKTHLLSVFRNNQKQSYQVTSCQDVEATYAKNGVDGNPQTGAAGISRFFGLLNMSTRNQYGQNTLGFLFDDLGQEVTNTKHFGTERNVMQEVLSQRYKNGLFTSTHITTNLSAADIKEVYGVRVADRMREMFNLISFPENAKSRRK